MGEAKMWGEKWEVKCSSWVLPVLCQNQELSAQLHVRTICRCFPESVGALACPPENLMKVVCGRPQIAEFLKTKQNKTPQGILMCSQSWERMWRTDGSFVPLGSWCGLPQGPQRWVECHRGQLQDPWWSTEEMDSPTGSQAALSLTCCVLRQETLSPRLQLLKKEGGLEGWFPMALDYSWAVMLRTLYLEGMALFPFHVPSPPGW